MKTITLAQLHALVAAASAQAPITALVHGQSFEMFDLKIEAGRAVLVMDERPAPWDLAAEDFAYLLHNEFYTTPAVMPVVIRDLLGREFPVAEQLRRAGERLAVVAGPEEIGASQKVRALYATARTRRQISRGGQ